MKYSILGFNQAKVCAITKEVQEGNKSKTYKLDMVDLVVLQDIADFMNRKNVIKYTLNEKIYFSITHNAILTDLPILDIKKQALKDRIDKMCLLGVIEKHIVRNDNGTWIGYRLTDVYESLAYSTDDNDGGVYQTTWGGCSELHEGGVSNYTPNINTTIKESTIKEKEKDIIISSKNDDKKGKFGLDMSFVNQSFMPIILEWLEYKREKKQSYKQRGFNVLYKNLMEMSNGNVEMARKIIDHSMQNNYAGLFPLKKQNTLFDNLPTGMIIRETQSERNEKFKNEKGW